MDPVTQQPQGFSQTLTGWEVPNEYKITNATGKEILKATEGDSHPCYRYCTGRNRGLTISVTDNSKKEIFRLTRQYKCCPCCWCADSCGFEIEGQTPDGRSFGFVRQHNSCCAPLYKIYDENHMHTLTLQGPACVCQTCVTSGDVTMKVLTADHNKKVGAVLKRWNGCGQECLKRNQFQVQCPRDMSGKTKALLMGALFLFDFMFYEYQGNGGG